MKETSVLALKDLIKAMHGLLDDNLDDERFMLFISPYIEEADKILNEIYSSKLQGERL